MDLQQFRASGRDVANLGTVFPGLDLEGKAGRVYADAAAYIERQSDSSWYVQIDRSEYSGALPVLEERLHEWCSGERVWEPARFEQLRREFPDYDVATLPPVPVAWEDTSWHNDAAPSFEPFTGCRVWVDYADAQRRELGPDRVRFGAYYEAEDAQSSTDTVDIYEGDDWDALLAAVIGFTPPCKAGRHTDTGRGVCADCGWAL